MKDKEKLQQKSELTWTEFKERIDGIFESIELLIQQTNGTKNDR